MHGTQIFLLHGRLVSDLLKLDLLICCRIIQAAGMQSSRIQSGLHLKAKQCIACAGEERPRGLRWLTPHNPAQVQDTWKRNNHHKIPSKVIKRKDKAQA